MTRRFRARRIGLQIHPNVPMKAEYRNVKLAELGGPAVPSGGGRNR
jgi:hypothetical protein